MDFVDQQLVRLADPATRAGVFDGVALQQLLTAAYDAPGISLQGPFTATFDGFRLGVAAQPLAALEGTWNPVGGIDRSEAHFRLSGLGDGAPRA